MVAAFGKASGTNRYKSLRLWLRCDGRTARTRHCQGFTKVRPPYVVISLTDMAIAVAICADIARNIGAERFAPYDVVGGVDFAILVVVAWQLLAAVPPR